jgi:hypothetical protein
VEAEESAIVKLQFAVKYVRFGLGVKQLIVPVEPPGIVTGAFN